MRRNHLGVAAPATHRLGGRLQLDLASQAVWEINVELRAMADRVFGHAERTPLERVRRFLDVVSRDPLKGCRVGRLAAESSIEYEELRVPVAAWFEYVEARIGEALEEARAAARPGVGDDDEGHVAAADVGVAAVLFAVRPRDEDWTRTRTQSTSLFCNAVNCLRSG